MNTQKLNYLPDELWAKLPASDYRARFFVETYTEKLSLYTPHFYQSRLMNVFSSCGEMLVYIQEHQSTGKHSAYITASLDEIQEAWDDDPIAKDVLRDLIDVREKAFSDARIKINSAALGRLKALCRAAIARQNRYSERLLQSLEDAVVATSDLSKKRSVLSKIYLLTGLYITYLLNRGHSPTYLFNRAQMFTRENKYSGRDFSQQMKWVTEKLGNQKTNYEVLFGIHTNKPSLLLTVDDEPGIEFSEEVPADVTGQDLEKLKRNIDITVFAKLSIESTDPVTAALKTKERLDKMLDAVTALELTPQIRVSAHCFVIFRFGSTTNGVSVNVDMLLAFMSSEVGTYFSHTEASIRQAYKGLDDVAKDQLGRSLRYLRLARDSVSMEQKLLNLWIALESLFERRDTAILPSILETVPKLYAVAGLRRRIRYLRDLLSANRIPATPLTRSIISESAFGESTSEEHVFNILRDEAAATELFSSLGTKEHLKFKLLSIFEELKDNSAISNRLKRSEKDVSRQLRRIYFLRNRIAHTGHHRGVRPQLATHLLDYIAICYKAIANAAASAPADESYSIAELLLAARMGADIVVANAGPGRPSVSNVNEVLLVPVI